MFEKTYAYVKRMSFPNATVENTQSIRQCVRQWARRVPHARLAVDGAVRLVC